MPAFDFTGKVKKEKEKRIRFDFTGGVKQGASSIPAEVKSASKPPKITSEEIAKQIGQAFLPLTQGSTVSSRAEPTQPQQYNTITNPITGKEVTIPISGQTIGPATGGRQPVTLKGTGKAFASGIAENLMVPELLERIGPKPEDVPEIFRKEAMWKAEDFKREPENTAEKIAKGIGTITGILAQTAPLYGAPGAGAAARAAGAGATKAAGKRLAPKAAQLAGKAAEIGTLGGMAGGAYGIIESTIKGETAAETAKNALKEAVLWGTVDMATIGVGAAVLKGARKLIKNKPKVDMEEIDRAVAKDIGVNLDDLNEKQKIKIRQLSERILEGPTINQAKLPAGQDFTFRDLTHGEIIGRVLPERLLALPAPEQGFTMQGEPLQFKTKAKGPVEVGRGRLAIEPEDAPLLDFFEKRGISLKKAEEQVQTRLTDLVAKQINYLKSSGGQGVEQGGMARDPITGAVIDRFGRVSKNPKWYRDFYQEYGRAPRENEYRELAIKQLREGFEDDMAGSVPPDKDFSSVENLLNKIKDLRSRYPEDVIKPQTKIPSFEFSSRIDAKYQSQYNTEKEIKNQLRKYYSAFDGEEGLDEAAGAIADLRKTEDSIRGEGREGQSNKERGIRARSGSNDSGWKTRGGVSGKPYKIVGLSFSQDLIDTGRVNLTGHKINDTKELAVISQVFRDPRFETFRIIYTKGNEIVGTDAISSRLPNASAGFVDSKPKYLNRTKIRMKRLEADGYYLLHNHPTGFPKPSQPDIDLTYTYARRLNGFKGHVVINSNKYSLIFPDYSTGKMRLAGNENLPLGLGEDRLLKPSIEHPLLGHRISSSNQLAALAKVMQNNDDIAVAFFTDSQLGVKGIQEIDKKMLNDTNFRNFLRNQAREHGGSKTFIVGDSSIEDNLKKLVINGDIMDAYIKDTGIALRDYVTPSPVSKDWMGLSAAQEGKGLRPPKPFDDTKFDLIEKQQPLLLPEPEVNFTLQGEPLQFKRTIAGPIERGTAVKPPADEPPLIFKKTIEVPRIEKERAFRDLPVSITEKILKRMSDVEMMAQRPPGGSISGESSGGVVPRKVMIDRLLKQLDVPARVGRIVPKRALGIFKVKPEVIRTKLAEDMPVIAHEVGHYLDKLFGIRNIVASDPAMVDELTQLGKTQPAKWFTEGIAEFMRRYLTGEDVKQLAPEFSKWFENTISAEGKVWDALQQFRQDYVDYSKAPAVARIKAAISTGKEGKRKVTIDRIMQAAVDDLRPVDSFVEKVTGGGKARKGLNATEDPFIQAWLFRGWTGKARNAIWYGVRDKNGKKVALGLNEILKPVANNIDDFRAYIVSRRATELHSRGMETGLDPEDVQQVIAELDNPEFHQAFEQLKAYQDAILDRMVESGIISGEQKALIRKLNQEYVPFYRVFDENAGGVGFGKRGFGDLTMPIKRLKGSGRTIVDPLESIIKNTYYMINLAERNNVGRTLVDFAQKFEGMGKFVEKVDPKVHPLAFNLSEIKKYLEQVGVDLPPDVLKEIATVFRPNMTGSTKENILTVWRNGKPELYQLDPDLYRAVLLLDQESTNTLIKLMSYPASWLRAGAVLNPEFAIRNVMRDAFGSWVFSKYGFVPGLDTVRGLFHVIGRDDLYQQWLSSGGAGATLVSLDRSYLQEDLRKLLTKDVWQKMKLYARHPLEVLRVLTEFSEEATRVGEFAKGVKAETKRGATMEEALQRASLASRDITLDFSRAGTVGRPANQLIAFFNAQVQGIDKMRRAFKERPIQTMFKVLPLTLASIALWGQNHDKPEYQQLPQWRKDLYWNFITDNHVVSIPKPFELGVLFMSLPERILDWANGVDPDAIQKWANSFRENLSPNWIPTAMLPILEVMTDYSFFQGRRLTPMGEQYLLKQEQYGPYTNEAAKKASQGLAAVGGGEAVLSPRQIENLVRGYTGGLGMHALDIASALMPKEYTPPVKDISDYPVIKAVVNKPFQGAEGVNDFYNRLEELEKKARTVKKYQEAGKSIPEKLQYNPAELRQLRRASDELAKLRKRKEQILKGNLTPEQKRSEIDALEIRRINIAQQALGRSLVQ